MNTEEVVEFSLISSYSLPPDITLPKVTYITNMREFMSDPENFNGNIDDLTNRLEEKSQQCKNIIKILKDTVQLKRTALHKVKEDIQDLSAEIKKDGAAQRFTIDREKVTLHFLDEKETNEYEASEALEHLSIKMNSLFSDILALESDVDYVTYLEGVSQINIDYAKDWYKTEIKNKNEEPIPESVGDDAPPNKE
ncbi:uncharacterized protein LOC108094794 [Drosophila ficusphila]|uniref:uncharacterized protein LOC108094794 n=1 Tax=Drosophila ficusphila TaxID=30025 RepID=UPI0007E78B11|nr:uncharacterized protein LOC108094794 [Drosophila ficusphila]